MKKKIFFVFFISFASFVYAYLPLNLVDTPTVETLPKGSYSIYLSSYEKGGIKLKVIVGLSDLFQLGISEDIGGLIGDDKVSLNIPGALIKFNILRSEEGKKSLGWSVGYDYFIEGEYGKTNVKVKDAEGRNVLRREIIYGLYSVWNLPFHLIGPGQNFSFGCRYPLLPWNMKKNFNNLTFFAGLDIPFNREFRVVCEIEEISLNFTDFSRVMLNAGFRYVAGDLLGVSFNFRYIPDQNKLSRLIVIEYQNFLF